MRLHPEGMKTEQIPLFFYLFNAISDNVMNAIFELKKSEIYSIKGGTRACLAFNAGNMDNI